MHGRSWLSRHCCVATSASFATAACTSSARQLRRMAAFSVATAYVCSSGSRKRRIYAPLLCKNYAKIKNLLIDFAQGPLASGTWVSLPRLCGASDELHLAVKGTSNLIELRTRRRRSHRVVVRLRQPKLREAAPNQGCPERQPSGWRKRPTATRPSSPWPRRKVPRHRPG